MSGPSEFIPFEDELARLRARISQLESELAAFRGPAADLSPPSIDDRVAELQAVLDSAPVAVWIAHDPECRRITGNAYADKIVMHSERGANVSLESGAQGASYRVFHQGVELRAQELPAQIAAATGTPVPEREYMLLFPDGRKVHTLMGAVHLFDAAGAVRGAVVAGVDVTALRTAEGALRDAHNFLNLHVDHSPLAVVEWDSEFRITRWAGEAFTVFGWTAAETVGKRIDELAWIHPVDGPLVEAVMADMLSGVRPSNVNRNRNLRKDGSVIHCEWYNSSIRDASGRLISVLSQVLDVTDRKRVEQALRESEDKFRTLADSIPQLAWMADGAGWIFWYNRRWYDYTGTTLDEMEGWGWHKVHHPDYVDRVAARFARCMETGEEWEDTFPLRGKDGRYRSFLSRAMPIRDAAGKVVRWVGTNTDITERLEAEERLRASVERFRRLYESDVVGIVLSDRDKVFESNDVFLSLIGYTRADLEAGGIQWRELTVPEHQHLDDRGIQELLTTGSCRPYEKEYQRPDGSRVPVLLGATVLDHSPLRWLAFVVDLTERKQLEKKLFDKQKLEGIGLLAGGIAHDFNNILVAIMGNASLAQEMVSESSPLASVLGEIVGASERAAHLTRQMLAYSGKGRFVVEPLDMSAVVSAMARLVQPLIPSPVDLRLELAGRLPAVEADAGQMQQVVMNLVINAAEAIGNHPGSVCVRTGVRDVDRHYIELALQNSEIEPGSCVFLEVRDTGCGMDEATLAHIFDPFFTTKFTGRGLGLAAVAGIVRGHKGAIQVASQPGRGSTFLVLFPALASPAPAGTEPRKPAVADCAGAGIILVVDDEQVVLRTARMALERHGYTVREAASGPEAIEALKCENAGIAAVILDLSMPGMSGHEALPLLRQIQPSLKVIVSSGYSQAETLRQFSGQPISGFIQKPYTSARLAESVKAALAADSDSVC